MFGYIMAAPEKLTECEKNRYRSVYCGLCRSLKRHGFLGRLTLNYDMTFLVLVLSSLYEPEETAACRRCIMHPIKKHDSVVNASTDYAADINLLLAWWNCMDDWEDEKKLSKRIFAVLIGKRVRELQRKYPRQSQSIADNLQRLKEYEQGEEMNPDRAADCFGALMGELFVWKEADYWASTLRKMGQGLGRFIYILDACVDYEEDEKRHRPNPLRSLGTARSREGDYDILSMLISDCTQAFELLPLEQDLSLMRNILYLGCWQRYYSAFESGNKKDRKKESTR